jgi:hypothetical protein
VGDLAEPSRSGREAIISTSTTVLTRLNWRFNGSLPSDKTSELHEGCIMKLALRQQNRCCIVPLYRFGYQLERIERHADRLSPPEACTHLA